MKLKKGFLISTLILISFVSLAIADQVQLYQQNGYSYSNGGEFTVKIIESINGPNLNLNWNYYSNLTRDIGNYDPSFQTFCLEKNEYFNPGTTYDVTISDKAYLGGIGEQGDPISVGTAWLYYMFATGQLGNYYYNYTPGNTSGDDRHEDAGKLQAAIWWLEGELNSKPSNEFIELVYKKFSDPTADNEGQYPVAVLNLWKPGHVFDFEKDPVTGKYKWLSQDQLVLVPEPATLLFLGAGLIGMGGFIRRRFKK